MSDNIQIKDITYILRSIKSGYSIHNVFMPIIDMLHAQYHEAPYERADVKSILSNIRWIRTIANHTGINHMTGGPHYFLLGIPFRKNVLTIHDLVLLKKSKGIKRWIFKLFWFKLPIKCCKAVTCISNTVREELLATISVPPQKVFTVYNPVSPEYIFTFHDFNTKYPRILHIGTAWNKNTENVIKALSGIKCKLVIIGDTTESIDKGLKDTQCDYELLKGLSNEELRHEYQEADIISFPSIFEGFGMPIIEGQATGRVVLTSNIAPMTEIAGNGACLVDPYDVKSIRSGFLKIIDDKEYRQNLIKNGIENCNRFSLENITGQYVKIYKKIYENSI